MIVFFYKFPPYLYPRNYSTAYEGYPANELATQLINGSYSIFQNVHVMVFIGFGMLYAYLKFHSWTSIGINFLLGAIAIEFSFLTNELFNCIFTKDWVKQEFSIDYLIDADFAAATVLVSLGAVLGKLSFPQYVVMCIFETFFYSLNYKLCDIKLHVTDAGGSMFIHAFGALFGVFCAWILFYNDENAKTNPKNTTGYCSNTFGFIGTVFLWLYWPSFNTGLLGGSGRMRGIINTYLSLVGSCVGAFLCSGLFGRGKVGMEDILNATFAGGVIIGGSNNIILYPYASLIIGFLGGIISTICFHTIGKCVKNIGIYDTCGILNIHGIPGILGGVITCIVVATVKKNDGYWANYYYADLRALLNWSASKLAGMQICALLITMGISIVAGIICGFLLKSPLFTKAEKLYTDEEYFYDAEEMLPKEAENPINSEKSTTHLYP